MPTQVICRNLTPKCLDGHVGPIEVYLSDDMVSISNAVLYVLFARCCVVTALLFFRRGECNNNNN